MSLRAEVRRLKERVEKGDREGKDDYPLLFEDAEGAFYAVRGEALVEVAPPLPPCRRRLTLSGFNPLDVLGVDTPPEWSHVRWNKGH